MAYNANVIKANITYIKILVKDNGLHIDETTSEIVKWNFKQFIHIEELIRLM
ncbi:hypothetical protein HYE32_00905 [Mycoplasmopsis bovis]|nr:hypothetical protein [Mycoplasmopsis bovis]QQH22209.1 hypothetical protein HYE32_00905 [Mycoplasmopsis bovis]